MSDFTVRLEQVFQGPLDLLLFLVKQQEVEIQEVEIASIVDGYLEYLDALRELDIEVAGDFLVMAATLMAIKSRSLLPREEVDLDDELDPEDELIQRLIEYRRFKEVSDDLGRRFEERQRLHGRGAHPELAERPEEVTLDLGELSVWDLLGTFSRLLRETLANQPRRVQGDPRPLRYYVRTLARTLRDHAAEGASLRELVEGLDGPPTRETLVGAFCALLELVKLGVCTVEQDADRTDIVLRMRPEVAEDVDGLLEASHFEDEGDPEGLDLAEESDHIPSPAEAIAAEPAIPDPTVPTDRADASSAAVSPPAELRASPIAPEPVPEPDSEPHPGGSR